MVEMFTNAKFKSTKLFSVREFCGYYWRSSLSYESNAIIQLSIISLILADLCFWHKNQAKPPPFVCSQDPCWLVIEKKKKCNITEMLYTTLVNYFSSYFYTWDLFFHPIEICFNSSNSLCLILLAFEAFILLKNTWIIIKESKIWAKKKVLYIFFFVSLKISKMLLPLR